MLEDTVAPQQSPDSTSQPTNPGDPAPSVEIPHEESETSTESIINLRRFNAKKLLPIFVWITIALVVIFGILFLAGGFFERS